VQLSKSESRIFVTRDDKKFNKHLSIPAMLVRKNDAADTQFNAIMSYFKNESKATSEDLEAIKGEEVKEE
jgi:uncharacterized protein with PIN domain